MSKVYDFSGGMFLKHAVECKYLSEALETLSPLVLQKIKEDYFSQLDDYDEPFCEQQYTHGSCLFVCSNSNPLISLIPRTASNFRL